MVKTKQDFTQFVMTTHENCIDKGNVNYGYKIVVEKCSEHSNRIIITCSSAMEIIEELPNGRLPRRGVERFI